MSRSQQPLKSELVHPEAIAFYRAVMNALSRARVPFLVGGAFALQRYTGIMRNTKDFDIFVLPNDVERTMTVLSRVADRVDLKYPHWLGKAYSGTDVVDVIFGSGNGICPVDQQWFEHAPHFWVLDVPARLVPIEEMIWQKAFIMERHRFDGSDVIHLLRAGGRKLDWERLVDRFGSSGMVLLAHLILYRFAYPACWTQTMETTLERLADDMRRDPVSEVSAARHFPDLCRGTLLSILDYLPDIQNGGYRDARLRPLGRMTAAEIALWTATFER